ncbi:hypothetical protein QEN19_000967 [Hanseniaspora menglaensis]
MVNTTSSAALKRQKTSRFFKNSTLTSGDEFKTNMNNKRILEKVEKNFNGLIIKRPKLDNNFTKNPKNYEKLSILDLEVQKLKLEHVDKLLMIQVGYKYKCFAEDAVKASSILNFMLIDGKRNIKNDTPDDWGHKNFAYCSLPEQRVKYHLKKLLHYGYKVGIVKQFPIDGFTNKFERKLTHVYTKATYSIMNEDFEGEGEKVIDEKGTILAIDMVVSNETRIFTLIYIELNTGSLIYDNFVESINTVLFSSLETRIKHISPSEICLKKNTHELLKKFLTIIEPKAHVYCVNKIFLLNPKEILQKLHACFNILYSYLQSYMLADTLALNTDKLKHMSNKDTCQLNSSILTNLNFFNNKINNESTQTVWGLLNNDNILTIYGKSILEQWIKNPLIKIELIEERSKAIQFLQKCELNNILFLESIYYFLKDFKNKNLLKTCNRLKMNINSPINRKELYYYLDSISKLRKIFDRHHEYIANDIVDPKGTLAKQSSLLSNIFININTLLNEKITVDYTVRMINIGSIFEKNMEEQIKKFLDLKVYDNSHCIQEKIDIVNSIKSEMHSSLESIKKKIGKPYLKFKDEIDFLIEVNCNYCKNIPDDWVVNSKTSLVVRYELPSIKQNLEALKLANLSLLKTCQLEYIKFIKKINQDYNEISNLLILLGNYDSLLCLAKSTKQFNCKPKFVKENGFIKLISSHNPLIKKGNSITSSLNIPNDIEVTSNKIFILTGPNSGGKTTLIKQVAYLTILAQLGCNTPCESHTQSLFNNFFIRTGSTDSLISQKSTFELEMEECQQIICKSDRQSLVMMDEIGKGTSNLDGMAITYALLKHFTESENDHGLVLFITHYHAIVSEFNQKNVYKMGFIKINDNEILLNFKLEPGASGESLGINTAVKAGLPDDVIKLIKDNRMQIDNLFLVKQFHLCLKNQDVDLLKKIINKV